MSAIHTAVTATENCIDSTTVTGIQECCMYVIEYYMYSNREIHASLPQAGAVVVWQARGGEAAAGAEGAAGPGG